MRFSSRSKMSIALSLVTLLALVGAFAATGIWRGHTSAAHAASPSSTPVKGQVTRVATLNLANMSTGSVKATGQTHAMPFRAPFKKGAATASALKAPQTTGSTTATGQLLHNFNGANSTDSMNVNGFDLEPPDQGLCVGGGVTVDIINLVIVVYRPNGTIVEGPISLNTFFGEPAAEFLSDPRCYFDPATNKFFATVLAIDPTNTASHTDIGVLTSQGNFVTIFHLDTTDLTDPGCPCFGNQPLFGIDQDNIYISNNEFSILGPQFNGAQVYAISKSQLVQGNPSPNFVHFGNLGIGGTIAASVEPAITVDKTAPAEYFLNSLDPFGTFDNRIGVWAMTNRQVVSTGGIPNFTNTVITSQVYGFPPNAETPVGFNSGLNSPTNGFITTDDDRMLQVQFIKGQLWSSLNTALTIAGESGVRSGAAWFEIHPSLNGTIIGKSTVTKQGYVASTGNYLLYPAVAASPNGSVAMVMTLTGPNTFPSAVYSVLKAGGKAFGPIQIAASGVTANTGFTAVLDPAGRWGDYSAAVIDPNGSGIWMATEYIPGAGDLFTNWGTRVFEVKA